MIRKKKIVFVFSRIELKSDRKKMRKKTYRIVYKYLLTYSMTYFISWARNCSDQRPENLTTLSCQPQPSIVLYYPKTTIVRTNFTCPTTSWSPHRSLSSRTTVNAVRSSSILTKNPAHLYLCAFRVSIVLGLLHLLWISELCCIRRSALSLIRIFL